MARSSSTPPNVAIYHPSFGAVGGAELLAAAEARVFRTHDVDARIVTESVRHDLWHDELSGIPVAEGARPSALRSFPWTTAARFRSRARCSEPLLTASDAIIAHNYPCNAMLGAMNLRGVRLWQVNEPSRPLYLPETHPTLTHRVETLGNLADDWLSQHFAMRLQSWQRRLSRGGKLLAKRRFDSTMTARLDGLFAISRYSQAMVHGIYGRCSDTIVYPSVRSSVRGVPNRHGVKRQALRVLTQSRLEPIKNIETVIRGFAAFARPYKSAQLHVVGDGPDFPRLQSISRQIARDQVTFHGFLDNPALEALAGECDVFALLPVDEPFGMVFTEAMTRGLLCVGPSHGGPSEILDEGKWGWTVDAFSADALSSAFTEIMELTDSVIDERRATALASVQQRFSERAMFASLRTVLHEYGVDV